VQYVLDGPGYSAPAERAPTASFDLPCIFSCLSLTVGKDQSRRRRTPPYLRARSNVTWEQFKRRKRINFFASGPAKGKERHPS
jgi:hypothetical protein